MSTIPVLAPRSIDEAADLVRDASRRRAVVLPVGAGTKRTWTRPAARHDLELSTRELTGIVAYEPGDGTVTALAGTRWSELVRRVAEHGHHLSPELPADADATVGGVVAAGQSGLDRLRFGPVRHHVLGLRVVMADGRIAKTGGRLVKNVTGFDLHRLHTGAHGTLGLVAEVSLRLHPAPESRAIGLAFAASRAEALAIARAALALPRTPWAVLVHDLVSEPRDRWMVAVLLAGRADVLADDVKSLRAAAPRVPVLSESEDPSRFEGTWSGQRALESGALSVHALRVTTAPGDVDRICAKLDGIAAALGTEVRLVLQPGLGIVHACFRDLDAGRASRIGSALASAGARIHWRGLDDDLRARVALFGDGEPAGIALMRRIRAAFDPHGLWASGRLAGGL